MVKRPWVSVAAVCVGGCAPDYLSLDEACLDTVPGEQHLLTQSDLIDRMTCYRRFVGLSPARVNRLVQRATESHANYLEINNLVSPQMTAEDAFLEDPANTGFTGFDVWDRLGATGLITPETQSGLGVWDVFFSNAGGEEPDEVLADPYFRDVAFQPLWVGAGYAELQGALGGRAAYMNVVYGFPSSNRTDRPVVFPRDGQTDVPRSWVPYGNPADPMSERSIVGFPITITVGSDSVSGGANPYELRVISATLTGGNQGSIPLIQVLPGAYPWGALRATVILAPIVPLEPQVEFTLEVELEWNVRSKTIVTTFTTGVEGEDTDVGF